MCMPTLLMVGVRREWGAGGDTGGIDVDALEGRARDLTMWRPSGGAAIGFVLLPWADVALICVADRCRVRPVREALLRSALAHRDAQAQAWASIDVDRTADALEWIERLPVRWGLVSKPWRWRWSSGPWHCGFGRKPSVLAPEWTGPQWRALWRDRLADSASEPHRNGPGIVGLEGPGETGRSDEIASRAFGPVAHLCARHSPGMDTCPPGPAAIEPSHGELALA